MTNELQNFIEQFYRITSKIQQMRTKKISFDEPRLFQDRFDSFYRNDREA